MKKNPALTSSYKAPASPRKIQKGDKGYQIVSKAFQQENEAETSSYIPPQSPIAIQPGDKGFEIVGKAYNKWLWTFPEWKNKKSKIINPAANWGLNAKPMTPAEMKKKMKGLYLKEGHIPGGLSSGMSLLDIVKHHNSKGHHDPKTMLRSISKELRMGINVELEHTTDRDIAREIAMDHLYEDPHYYTKLKKIENK